MTEREGESRGGKNGMGRKKKAEKNQKTHITKRGGEEKRARRGKWRKAREEWEKGQEQKRNGVEKSQRGERA